MDLVIPVKRYNFQDLRWNTSQGPEKAPQPGGGLWSRPGGPRRAGPDFTVKTQTVHPLSVGNIGRAFQSNPSAQPTRATRNTRDAGNARIEEKKLITGKEHGLSSPERCVR